MAQRAGEQIQPGRQSLALPASDGSEGFLTEGFHWGSMGLGSLPPVINLNVSSQIQTIMGETCWQFPFKQKGDDGVFLRI